MGFLRALWPVAVDMPRWSVDMPRWSVDEKCELDCELDADEEAILTPFEVSAITFAFFVLSFA